MATLWIYEVPWKILYSNLPWYSLTLHFIIKVTTKEVEKSFESTESFLFIKVLYTEIKKDKVL